MGTLACVAFELQGLGAQAAGCWPSVRNQKMPKEAFGTSRIMAVCVMKAS